MWNACALEVPIVVAVLRFWSCERRHSTCTAGQNTSVIAVCTSVFARVSVHRPEMALYFLCGYCISLNRLKKYFKIYCGAKILKQYLIVVIVIYITEAPAVSHSHHLTCSCSATFTHLVKAVEQTRRFSLKSSTQKAGSGESGRLLVY